MTLEENLVAELTGASEITALKITSPPGTAERPLFGGRIYPDFVPEPSDPPNYEKSYPCATYTREKTPDEMLISGATSPRPVTFSIRVYGMTHAEAKRLADAIAVHLTTTDVGGIRGKFGTDGNVVAIHNPEFRDASYDAEVLAYRMDLTFDLWTTDA